MDKKGGKLLKQQFDCDVERTQGDGNVGEIFLDHPGKVRSPKIEAEGDRFKGSIKSKIGSLVFGLFARGSNRLPRQRGLLGSGEN